MKPRINPINNEITLSRNEFIISKTDPSGRITYSNRVFMRIAGYSEKELLKVQHNIVRHPDMPRGVFHFLWQTIKQGKEFFGFVKNLCADGSYYWVFANVSPDYDRSGKLQGYFSVRRKPSEKAIATVEPIYREMLAIEKRSGPKDAAETSLVYLNQVLASHGVSYEEFVFDLQPAD